MVDHILRYLYVVEIPTEVGQWNTHQEYVLSKSLSKIDNKKSSERNDCRNFRVLETIVKIRQSCWASKKISTVVRISFHRINRKSSRVWRLLSLHIFIYAYACCKQQCKEWANEKEIKDYLYFGCQVKKDEKIEHRMCRECRLFQHWKYLM